MFLLVISNSFKKRRKVWNDEKTNSETSERSHGVLEGYWLHNTFKRLERFEAVSKISKRLKNLPQRVVKFYVKSKGSKWVKKVPKLSKGFPKVSKGFQRVQKG